jgi:iron complex outermembrane receptor protein
MIYYKTETGGGVTNKYRMNAGKARTYGLELEASQKLTEMFTLWGNYTFTHAKITDNPTDPASEGKRVTGIPWHTFNIGLDSQYKWVKCSLIGRYFSKIYNATDNSDRQNGVYGTYEESFVVDAKLTVSPYTWQGMEMDLSFFVDNIFDKKYYQYYKMDGRSFFTELCIRY